MRFTELPGFTNHLSSQLSPSALRHSSYSVSRWGGPVENSEELGDERIFLGAQAVQGSHSLRGSIFDDFSNIHVLKKDFIW